MVSIRRIHVGARLDGSPSLDRFHDRTFCPGSTRDEPFPPTAGTCARRNTPAKMSYNQNKNARSQMKPELTSPNETRRAPDGTNPRGPIRLGGTAARKQELRFLALEEKRGTEEWENRRNVLQSFVTTMALTMNWPWAPPREPPGGIFHMGVKSGCPEGFAFLPRGSARFWWVFSCTCWRGYSAWESTMRICSKENRLGGNKKRRSE